MLARVFARERKARTPRLVEPEGATRFLPFVRGNGWPVFAVQTDGEVQPLAARALEDEGEPARLSTPQRRRGLSGRALEGSKCLQQRFSTVIAHRVDQTPV